MKIDEKFLDYLWNKRLGLCKRKKLVCELKKKIVKFWYFQRKR